jgi:hypothetical protein
MLKTLVADPVLTPMRDTANFLIQLPKLAEVPIGKG